MADRPPLDDKNRYLKLVYFASAAVYVVFCTLAFRIDWSIGILPICYGICYYVLLAVTNSTLSIGSFVAFKATVVIYAAVFGAVYGFLHFDKKDGWVKGGDYTVTVISTVFAAFFSIVGAFYFRHYVYIDFLERGDRVRNINNSNPYDRIVIKDEVVHIFKYLKPIFLASLVSYVLMCAISVYFIKWVVVAPLIAGVVHHSVMAIALFWTPYRLLFVGCFIVFKGVVSFILVIGSFILMALLHRKMAFMIGGAIIAWILIIFFLCVTAYFYRYYLFLDYQEKGSKDRLNETEMAEKQPMMPDRPILGVPFPSAPPEEP
ncbi:hypothetical protein QR680_015359 [Steinernema hermaphroditum]|uniref:Uncharacterized protein n=1 Tax=Steinernema hermaphroditum TaxID=289476 RepID=A0AA39H7E7_9BILA|nr:hypothetical protein QR680_015359 [Steinernema hermaphroditum]